MKSKHQIYSQLYRLGDAACNYLEHLLYLFFIWCMTCFYVFFDIIWYGMALTFYLQYFGMDGNSKVITNCILYNEYYLVYRAFCCVAVTDLCFMQILDILKNYIARQVIS